MSDTLRGMVGPDGGETQVIERGGKSILSSLKQNDPFKPNECIYKENCMVNKDEDCTQVGICYQVTCNTCEEEVIDRAPSDRQRAQVVAGRRRSRPVVQYIGQSGRTLHARADEHQQAIKRHDEKNAMYKHVITKHEGQDTPKFTLKAISKHKTNLARLIMEGIHIEKGRISSPDSILNSKSEWGAGKQIRFTPTMINH